MEALAAVGLAGNIAQFLDFTCQLIKVTASIQRSHTGAAVTVEHVTAASARLHQQCHAIVRQQKRCNQRPRIVLLAKDCEAAAKEIGETLGKLATNDPESKSHWKSFRVALATVWNESKISQMEANLNSYRLQLLMELSLLQDEKNQNICKLLDQASEQRRQIGMDTTAQISNLKHDMEKAIDTLRTSIMAMQFNQVSISRSSVQGIDTASLSVDMMAQLSTTMKSSLNQAFSMATPLTVLDSLAFHQMKNRRSQIREAHPQTFHWFFDEQFEPWILSSDPILWVSGKPGSGKSTLMKYLTDNVCTQQCIARWASTERVTVADYFFWVTGTHNQRSQVGLLRGLLYDILLQNPHLIQEVLPEACESIRSRIENGTQMSEAGQDLFWTRERLLETFQRLANSTGMTKGLCIFIDGLDEYEGNHSDLIETIHHLSRLEIKLCIASRPWNVFEEAFGANPIRKLYLQEFNKPDIQRFVEEQFQAQPNYRRMDPALCAEVNREIVEKSKGVFLWVRLVVHSLIEGIRNRDTIKLMRKRLREFPEDLNQYFRRIFDSVEAVYKNHLSHAFQIAMSVHRPLSPFAYWFLDETEDNPDFALAMEFQEVSIASNDVLGVLEDIDFWIRARSKGLLEVTTISLSPQSYFLHSFDPKLRVDFLHRTAKDFCATSEVYHDLQKWQTPGFDADKTLCSMLLAELKYFGFTLWKLMMLESIEMIVAEFLEAASRLEKAQSPLCMDMLKEFDKVYTNHLRCNNAIPNSGNESFLELAVSYDLLQFVSKEAVEHPPPEDVRIRLIKQILRNIKLDKTEIVEVPNIMKVLLRQCPPRDVHLKFSAMLFNGLDDIPACNVVKIMKTLIEYNTIQTARSSRDLKYRKLQDKMRIRLSPIEYSDVFLDFDLTEPVKQEEPQLVVEEEQRPQEQQQSSIQIISLGISTVGQEPHMPSLDPAAFCENFEPKSSPTKASFRKDAKRVFKRLSRSLGV